MERFLPFPMEHRIRKIVSGGQTGVDRAALDVAMELGIPCGGACPRGRLAEDGRIPDHYPLTELASAAYWIRTRRNIRNSDGTLILTRGPMMGGTRLTFVSAVEMGRPCLAVNLEEACAGGNEVDLAADWLERWRIAVLNVAGPRASQQPGIGREASAFLRELMRPSAAAPRRLVGACSVTT